MHVLFVLGFLILVGLRNYQLVAGRLIPVLVTRKPFTSNHTGSHPNANTSIIPTRNVTYKLYYDNVILLGQFNYALDAHSVQIWVQKWKQVFKHVQVRGPFNSTHISQLRRAGVSVYWGEDDAGYVSPMRNMGHTLRMYQNDPDIVGVVQVHDDAFLNLTEWDRLGWPSSDTILSQAPPIVTQRPLLYFSTQSSQHRWSGSNNWKPAETWPNGNWRWWPSCLQAFSNASRLDVRAQQYTHMENNIPVVPFWANAVGDVSYIPTKYAAQFSHMADWLCDHKVFLECGTPTLHGYLQDYHNATVQFLQTCTHWGTNRRTYAEWVEDRCQNQPNLGRLFPQPTLVKPPYGIIHPAKLSVYGPQVWSEHFDKFVL